MAKRVSEEEGKKIIEGRREDGEIDLLILEQGLNRTRLAPTLNRLIPRRYREYARAIDQNKVKTRCSSTDEVRLRGRNSIKSFSRYTRERWETKRDEFMINHPESLDGRVKWPI